MCRVSVRNARFRVPVSVVSNKVPAVIALAEYITPASHVQCTCIKKMHPNTDIFLLLFNKLSLCPYMVRKPSISVILHDRYPAIYVNDHIWKYTADFLSLLVWRPF